MEETEPGCESDRISNLPVEITDRILTMLPLREVVRTSILSRDWRLQWTKIPKLVIDDTICRVPEANKNNYHDHQLAIRYKIMSTINQILLHHDGPILEFNLSHSLFESCPEIDHLILFLSKKRVQKFTFKPMEVFYSIYKMPSSFFSCRELTHLDISDCWLTLPPGFKGFPRLVSLKFVNVVYSMDMHPKDIFYDLVSRCPLLESLTLIRPPRNQFLTVTGPNLKYLHFEGSFEFLKILDVPNLQSGLFVIDKMISPDELQDEQICRSFSEFFGCLPALKKFSANTFLLEHFADADGVVPKKLSISIGLKVLKLSRISFRTPNDVSGVFCLISCSPSLQRIEIEMFNERQGDPDFDMIDEDILQGFPTAQDYAADVILNELQAVHLTCFSGIKTELELIKLLLANSPVLETMVIEPYPIVGSKGLKLLKKLKRFQRASPMAKIIMKNSKPWNGIGRAI